MVCSRGESLAHHMNKMKLFNAFAAAAVIGASLISPNSAYAGLEQQRKAQIELLMPTAVQKGMIAKLNSLVKD